MRTAGCFGLLLCAGLSVGFADEPAEYFVKFGGGQVRDDSRVIGDKSSLQEPLVVLEERQDSVRVALKGGSAGWVRRSEIGTLAEVLKDASQKIADQPDEVELRWFRVQLAARRNAPGDREQTLADLAHIVQLAPNDVRGYMLRGSLAAKNRQFEAAAADFTQALKIDPALPAALLERGLAYCGLRDFEAAIADFDAYARLQPQTPEVYAARAAAHVELEQYDAAEADFTRAIGLDGKSPHPWFERARMWMRRHDAPAAVSDLSETLKRDPKHLDATMFLATLLACGPDDTPRDGKRAVELAQIACKLAENDFRPVEALAAAHAETGNFALAIHEQEKALDILKRKGAAEGAQAAARFRLSRYRTNQPVRLMR